MQKITDILINNLGIKIIGIILIMTSIIWALAKKRYDIAIGLIITLVAYSMLVFVFLGGANA